MDSHNRRPEAKPLRPFFSSGPCAKRPGWSPAILEKAVLGRSHRAPLARSRLRAVIEESRELLGLPEDYRLAIVPGSDTGAIEMALWSLLGALPVSVIVFDSFGRDWAYDIAEELRLSPRRHEAPFGALPDLAAIDWQGDVVFPWNGTTSGVRIPDGDWIAGDRAGLAICDATSAVFAMELPWRKIDVATWSWQKALGGEAAHGMIALSPRALDRLARHRPAWPIPKIFRLARNGKIDEGPFVGDTINTPSMLAVEDQLDALAWARSIGGLPELIARCRRNSAILAEWVAVRAWVDFLAEDSAIRSPTSLCLKIGGASDLARRMAALLDREGIAFDIAAYREAPPGLRIWCGATVEAADIAALLPWLDWAYEECR